MTLLAKLLDQIPAYIPPPLNGLAKGAASPTRRTLPLANFAGPPQIGMAQDLISTLWKEGTTLLRNSSKQAFGFFGLFLIPPIPHRQVIALREYPASPKRNVSDIDHYPASITIQYLLVYPNLCLDGGGYPPLPEEIGSPCLPYCRGHLPLQVSPHQTYAHS